MRNIIVFLLVLTPQFASADKFNVAQFMAAHQLSLFDLARYTRKGMMSESRLVKHTQSSVSFKYQDYRDNNQNKVMTLDTEEFIRRYLQHILPKGLMRIRHYGF